MANDQEQLVRQVTEQVLSAMGKTVLAAPIHPPIGTCTGDYSKFPELRGNVVTPDTSRNREGAGGAGPGNGRPLADARGSSPEALRGIVTAKHLEGRGKVVRLASCAKLTPLAADYVKENRITLERGAAVGGNAGPAMPQAAGAWFWWCDGQEPGVDAVMTAFRAQVKPMSQQRSAGAVVDVIKQLGRRVTKGEASGAVLFVDTAARAACFANRHPALRAVVGTGDAAVERGVREIAANVLIVEHPSVGRRSMRDMVSRFVSEPRAASGDVERQLREMMS